VRLLKRKGFVFWPTKILARICFTPFFQLRTGGAEYLPAESAFVLLPKHQRWEDIPLLSLATPRPLYYMAKSELFRNPISRWFFSSLGGIPLNRERPMESRGSLYRMIDHTRRGEGIVIFPEGTYYRDKLGPGRVGLIKMILSRASVPFVPVGFKYSKKRNRTEVEIRFGEPICPDPSASAEDFLTHIMKEIGRLSGL
jgi:1-acyl-sn-glycerol-3-phosphate acyltransferase